MVNYVVNHGSGYITESAKLFSPSSQLSNEKVIRVPNGDESEKKRLLELISHSEKELGYYDDPIYTVEEKAAIKNYEDFALNFFRDLKADGFVGAGTFPSNDREKAEQDKTIKFFKIAMDISNKLVSTKEFAPNEQWFLLITVYCWYSEMIKNLLIREAKSIYKSFEGRNFPGFMTLGNFLREVRRYKDGKYTTLFEDIDSDLRNSFNHANIDFNSEITYQDNNGNGKSIKPEKMLSISKKIAPLYGTLFAYRLRVFLPEMKYLAKQRGYL
jgi:hypothetical protein